MNKLNNVLWIMLVALLSACAPGTPDTSADEAALKADPVAWFDAFNAGNADSVANLYAEDGVLMPPGGPAVTGRAAIREAIVADIAKMRGAGLSNRNDANTGVGVSGDMGWVSGSFSVVDASGTAVDTGKFLTVYRRMGDDWQIIRDTWNSDMEPAAAAPATPVETPAEPPPAQ